MNDKDVDELLERVKAGWWEEVPLVNALALVILEQRREIAGLHRQIKGLTLTIRTQNIEIVSHGLRLDIARRRIIERIRAVEENRPVVGNRYCTISRYPEDVKRETIAIIEEEL